MWPGGGTGNSKNNDLLYEFVSTLLLLEVVFSQRLAIIDKYITNFNSNM